MHVSTRDHLTGAHTELMPSSSPSLLAMYIARSKRVIKLSAPSSASYSHPAIVTAANRMNKKRGTTEHNRSRNDRNYVKRIVNQHESPTDIVAGCQPNTFQMLPRYHAESWLTTPTISTS